MPMLKRSPSTSTTWTWKTTSWRDPRNSKSNSSHKRRNCCHSWWAAQARKWCSGPRSRFTWTRPNSSSDVHRRFIKNDHVITCTFDCSHPITDPVFFMCFWPEAPVENICSFGFSFFFLYLFSSSSIFSLSDGKNSWRIFWFIWAFYPSLIGFSPENSQFASWLFIWYC